MIDVDLIQISPYVKRRVRLPAIPREGDSVQFEGCSGTVARVTWIDDGALVVSVFLR